MLLERSSSKEDFGTIELKDCIEVGLDLLIVPS